jgi:hypothetical protein
MWIPDVYDGAPTPVTLFIGSAPKIAAFAMAMRLLPQALGGLTASWQEMLIILAVLSLAIGNVVAIAQTNIKRMLAYSTISPLAVSADLPDRGEPERPRGARPGSSSWRAALSVHDGAGLTPLPPTGLRPAGSLQLSTSSRRCCRYRSTRSCILLWRGNNRVPL